MKTNVHSEDRIKFIERFVAEAKIMLVMKHERVVEFINLDLDTLSIIMEMMPLGSLYAYIGKEQEKMSWKDRHQMMIDLCDGMEFLHAGTYADGSPKMELFHQDIKSSNVLLSYEDGKLRSKITDFGLSCKSRLVNLNIVAREVQNEQSQVTHMGGTKDYLAPELLLRRCKFTKKCDVFAAGVVFLELLTLERPTELFEECWPKIAEEKLLPYKMKLALEKCLNDDPAKRGSFAEVKQVLLNGEAEIRGIEQLKFTK
jgi:serine/threonine protein kinase